MNGRVLESLIGEVAHCLGHGAERGRRLDPSHRASHGDTYELRLVLVLGQHQSQAQAVQGAKEEAIEAVLDVSFSCSNRSEFRISMTYDGEKAGAVPIRIALLQVEHEEGWIR